MRSSFITEKMTVPQRIEYYSDKINGFHYCLSDDDRQKLINAFKTLLNYRKYKLRKFGNKLRCEIDTAWSHKSHPFFDEIQQMISLSLQDTKNVDSIKCEWVLEPLLRGIVDHNRKSDYEEVFKIIFKILKV